MSLRLGSRGDSVATVQQRLNAEGANIAVDGKYGGATTAAVAKFQREHHLKSVDGVVGPETRAAMGMDDGFDIGPPGGRTTPAPSTPGVPTPSAPAPLLTPAEMELAPMEKMTLSANRLAGRIEEHNRRGEPVPPNEAQAARVLSHGLDDLTLPLMTGEGGRQVNDLSVASARLRDAVKTLP